MRPLPEGRRGRVTLDPPDPARTPSRIPQETRRGSGRKPGRGPLKLAVATAFALLAIIGIVACGSDSEPRPIPAAEAFTPGVCEKLAPGVVDTMRIVRAGHEGPDGSDKLANELISPQERLYDQIATAGPHAAEVERVTTAIGWLRLRVAADTYEPSLLAEVTTATDALADSCT
jgi:hypothetical protein